jgi:hypothetical protein
MAGPKDICENQKKNQVSPRISSGQQCDNHPLVVFTVRKYVNAFIESPSIYHTYLTGSVVQGKLAGKQSTEVSYHTLIVSFPKSRMPIGASEDKTLHDFGLPG